MEAKVDMTLYNQVKAKFSPKKGFIILISLPTNNAAEAKIHEFTKDRLSDYTDLMYEHKDSDRTFAAFSYLGREPEFYFASKDFCRIEDLNTQKITSFRLGPLRTDPIDIEKLKNELTQLPTLLRNSQAS